MSLDGGLGDITQKNNQLVTPVTEKLSAVRHCNGKDLWIIVHKAGGPGTGFFAYLLTNNGINSSPVVSNVDGVGLTGGQLKISPNGRKMAADNPYLPFSTVLFDFDNQTGTVSNPVTLLQLNPTDIVYGVEFSPNSTFLYTTLQILHNTQPSQRAVLKYNVTLPAATDIIASRDTVFIETLNSLGNANLFGSMQLGPDKKIYISPLLSQYLAVIPDPDSPGKAAGFNVQGVYLGGKKARLGLPNFPAGFILAPLSGKRIDTFICTDQSIVLHADPTATSYLWQDGTTAASTTVTSPGLYWVQETITNGVCRLLVPNAFTPNGDGRNERFRAFFGENVVSYSLQIYNRWGQRVFASNSKNVGWDGTLNGHAQPAGTYTWVIRYKVMNNMRDMYLKGNVLLIR
jgi:gliding motility-associated-like protein